MSKCSKSPKGTFLMWFIALFLLSGCTKWIAQGTRETVKKYHANGEVSRKEVIKIYEKSFNGRLYAHSPSKTLTYILTYDVDGNELKKKCTNRVRTTSKGRRYYTFGK